jgi:effector-binding domain-containing protein
MTAASEAHVCELRQAPERAVMVVRFHCPVTELPRRLGEVYSAVFAYLAEMRVPPAGPPFAAYHNFDRNNLDVEAGCAVSAPLPGRGEVQPGRIEAGPEAFTLHVGPYSTCEAAYQALMNWMLDHGYKGTEVAYEFYLDDPAHTPPHALRTEIVFPIKA